MRTGVGRTFVQQTGRQGDGGEEGRGQCLAEGRAAKSRRVSPPAVGVAPPGLRLAACRQSRRSTSRPLLCATRTGMNGDRGRNRTERNGKGQGGHRYTCGPGINNTAHAGGGGGVTAEAGRQGAGCYSFRCSVRSPSDRVARGCETATLTQPMPSPPLRPCPLDRGSVHSRVKQNLQELCGEGDGLARACQTGGGRGEGRA
jgi:hypothetical protein